MSYCKKCGKELQLADKDDMTPYSFVKEGIASFEKGRVLRCNHCCNKDNEGDE